MRRALWVSLVLGCQVPSSASAPSSPNMTTPSDPTSPSAAASVPPSSAPAVASAPLGAPLTGAPRLVVENHATVDVDISGVYLVDERGALGTMELWPHRFDCPDYEPKKHLVPKGGTYEMPPPVRSYDSEKCAPGPMLPPGRYVLLVDGGYGEDFYAVAALDLPLTEPARLRLIEHSEDPRDCDSQKAQRAARLVFDAVQALPGLGSDFLAGCDIAKARCGTLPLEDAPPPPVCTVTLHENLLRVDRPAGDDALRGVSSWLDREIVAARQAEVDRTSASRVQVGDHTVILEGTTSHHRHMHGGAAAGIGFMSVQVYNPTGRALNYSVHGVEWLVDHSCGLPTEVVRRPTVEEATPRTLPPGESELEISFDEQGAYMAHCDRFASRVSLRVEGKPTTVTVEHEVVRYEPLRR